MIHTRFNGGLLAAAALACFIPAFPLAAQPTPGAMTPVRQQMPHISVEVLGTSGSPVILIPGLSTPRAVWDRLGSFRDRLPPDDLDCRVRA